MGSRAASRREPGYARRKTAQGIESCWETVYEKELKKSLDLSFHPSNVGRHGKIITMAMTDPITSLKSFQQALIDEEISPQRAKLHDDVLVLLDHPNGKTRFTYALVKDQRVVAVAIFVLGDPLNGSPCFNTGYAVDEAYRSRGYGKEVVRKALDELINGFRRAKVPHLYVEAIVSTSNEHSKKLASALFTDSPTEGTDAVSGQPALQYVRQLF